MEDFALSKYHEMKTHLLEEIGRLMENMKAQGEQVKSQLREAIADLPEQVLVFLEEQGVIDALVNHGRTDVMFIVNDPSHGLGGSNIVERTLRRLMLFWRNNVEVTWITTRADPINVTFRMIVE